jgi:hypothetical protein
MAGKGKGDSASAESKSETTRAPKPRSEKEARVWALFEEARQKVKSRVIRELEGEAVGEEILNLRLKAN